MNKSKTLSCGIDIAAPGGVAKLLAFHRNTFGNAVMTAGPVEPETPKPADPPKPSDPPGPAVKADEDDIEGMGDAGKRALQQIRKERDEATRKAAEVQRKLDDRERAEMSELQKAQKDAEDRKVEAEKLRTENFRLRAIAHHEIPEEYQELVHGTDEASFKASAEKVARLSAAAAGKVPPAPKPDPVPGSGGGHSGSSGSNSSGSIASGQDAYNARHKKNKA